MKPETRSFYEIAVEKAVERVIANLDQALDLEALARSAAISTFHFHRVFRGMLGETPLELHRRLRMERAAYFLAFAETPITRVAFDAGYETHESFTRAFRVHYDCSPSEFRERARAVARECGASRFQIELASRSGIHFGAVGSNAPAVHFTRTPPFIQGEEVMQVQIKRMPALRVATVRHVGPYNQISEAFARLGELVGPAGLIQPGATMLAIFRDDPETVPAAELRSDAALSVPPDAALPAGLGEEHLAAGRYATTTHVGPYEQLGDAWARLMGEWLPRSGERLGDGVSYEIYRNTPGEVPKEKLVTELYVPLT